MKDIRIQFKSIPKMFEKEKTGAKSNTLRKIDLKDDRFKWLRQGHRRLVIINTETQETFERFITDYTEWEGWAIISWRSDKE